MVNFMGFVLFTSQTHTHTAWLGCVFSLSCYLFVPCSLYLYIVPLSLTLSLRVPANGYHDCTGVAVSFKRTKSGCVWVCVCVKISKSTSISFLHLEKLRRKLKTHLSSKCSTPRKQTRKLVEKHTPTHTRTTSHSIISPTMMMMKKKKTREKHLHVWLNEAERR